jgi:hypothetical protein
MQDLKNLLVQCNHISWGEVLVQQHEILTDIKDKKLAIKWTSSNESYGRVYPHSSESALIICQSGFDSPAGGTATLVCYTRPSVET